MFINIAQKSLSFFNLLKLFLECSTQMFRKFNCAGICLLYSMCLLNTTLKHVVLNMKLRLVITILRMHIWFCRLILHLCSMFNTINDTFCQIQNWDLLEFDDLFGDVIFRNLFWKWHWLFYHTPKVVRKKGFFKQFSVKS